MSDHSVTDVLWPRWGSYANNMPQGVVWGGGEEGRCSVECAHNLKSFAHSCDGQQNKDSGVRAQHSAHHQYLASTCQTASPIWVSTLRADPDIVRPAVLWALQEPAADIQSRQGHLPIPASRH